jgi:predicted alpha/beta superfamily hydrolase
LAYKFKQELPANPDTNAGWEEGRNRQLFLRQPAETVRRPFNSPPEPMVLSRVGTIRVHPAFPSRLVAPRDEYTPTYVEHKRPDGVVVKGGGKAGLYGRFLSEELKPFIDRTYRTRKDAAHTAVGGASLGGLVSLWLALEHPQVFGAALGVSPAIWWDDDFVPRKVVALPRKLPLKIWLDIGTLEGDDDVAAVRRMRDALEAKGWKLGTDLAYVEQEGSQHDEISWAARVEGMLTFLYGRKGGR